MPRKDQIPFALSPSTALRTGVAPQGRSRRALVRRFDSARFASYACPERSRRARRERSFVIRVPWNSR